MKSSAQAVTASAAAASTDGRSTRWAKHREERRAELLSVARRAIHQGGPQLTMDEIAQASGTSKSIMYRYFQDKAELQRALGLQLLSAMHRQLANERTIHAMIRTFVSAAAESRNLFEFVMLPSDGLNHFLSSVTRLTAATLPKAVSVQDRELWAAGAIHFVQGSVSRWLRADSADPISALSADQMTDHLVSWLLSGPPSH